MGHINKIILIFALLCDSRTKKMSKNAMSEEEIEKKFLFINKLVGGPEK